MSLDWYRRSAAEVTAALDGGGGGSLIHQAPPIVLTDAQIQVLPSTYYTIIAAPSGSHFIQPILATYVLDFTGGAYVGPSEGDELVLVAGSAGEPYVFQASEFDTLASAAVSDAIMRAVGPFSAHDSDLGSAWQRADVMGASLRLTVYGGGDLTGGHAANTLTVTVLYSLFNISTGLFE